MRLHKTAKAEADVSAFSDLNELYRRVNSGCASLEEWELYASICGRGLHDWQRVRGSYEKGALEHYPVLFKADERA